MKLFLNGGGCGKQTILTYKEINKIIDHNKPVLYVPLAMDETEHPYDSCYEWIKEEISSIDVPNIEMVRSFEEFAESVSTSKFTSSFFSVSILSLTLVASSRLSCLSNVSLISSTKTPHFLFYKLIF